MKKVLLICSFIFVTNILANQQECLYYLKKSNTSQDELALYIVNDLKEEAYLSARDALKYSIKAQANCKEYKNINLLGKIKELKGLVEKYKP